MLAISKGLVIVFSLWEIIQDRESGIFCNDIDDLMIYFHVFFTLFQFESKYCL